MASHTREQSLDADHIAAGRLRLGIRIVIAKIPETRIDLVTRGKRRKSSNERLEEAIAHAFLLLRTLQLGHNILFGIGLHGGLPPSQILRRVPLLRVCPGRIYKSKVHIRPANT